MLSSNRVSLVAQMVKNLPAIQETRVQSLGGEDPMEKGMAAHSSILAWRIPWTEKPGGATVPGVTKSQTPLKQLTLQVTGDWRGRVIQSVEKQDEHTMIMTESERWEFLMLFFQLNFGTMQSFF